MIGPRRRVTLRPIISAVLVGAGLLSVPLGAASSAKRAVSASRVLSLPTPPAGVSPRAVLDRYCVSCHNNKIKTAGLTLETISVDDLGSHAETWEKIVR